MLSGAVGNSSALCQVFTDAGCCSASFFQGATAVLGMTCHALTAQTVNDMVSQCPKPLPAACPHYSPANFKPPSGCPIANGITIPAAQDDCGIPPGTCPQNACQWICAVTTDDPPAGVSASALPALPPGSLGAGDAALATCASQATGEGDLEAGCASAGAQLRELVAVLSLSPELFTGTDANALQHLCTPQGTSGSSCVTQLATRFGAYADILMTSSTSSASSSSSAASCDASLAPNLAPLSQMLLDAMCLAAPQQPAGSCAPLVASALAPTTLLQSLFASQQTNASAIIAQAPAICAALQSTGCCGTAFLEAAFASAQMTCRPDLAQALSSVASSCEPSLSPPCSTFSIPSYDVTSGDCAPVAWPSHGCGVQLNGACPSTPCELACAAARPAAAATAAAWPVAPGQGEPVAAAAYLTACLEASAGAPFTPACAATYADSQALLSLALNAPQQFGADDTAVLQQLCTPRSGAYPCMSQLATMAGDFFAQVGEPSPAQTFTTCDTHLGPNVEALTSMALQFACLTNSATNAPLPSDAADNVAWCLPAAAYGLSAGGLSGLLRASQFQTVTPAQVAAAAPAVCAGLAAANAGCCAASLFKALSISYTALCASDLADAVDSLAATCSAPPYQLTPNTCPAFAAVNIRTPPSGCSLGVDFAPTTCGLAPASCPSSPCQLLCAVATNDPPANSSALIAGIQASLPTPGTPIAAAAWNFNTGLGPVASPVALAPAASTSPAPEVSITAPIAAAAPVTAALPAAAVAAAPAAAAAVASSTAASAVAVPSLPPAAASLSASVASDVTSPSSAAANASTWSTATTWMYSAPAPTPAPSAAPPPRAASPPSGTPPPAIRAVPAAAGGSMALAATAVVRAAAPPETAGSSAGSGVPPPPAAANRAGDAAQYLTTCLNAAPTGRALSARCTSEYQVLEQLLGTLAHAPAAFSNGNAHQLASLCAASNSSLAGKVIPSCVSQYRASAAAYMADLPNAARTADWRASHMANAPPPAPGAPKGSGEAACEAALGPQTASALLAVAGALMCASDDVTGSMCLPVLASALSGAGLWSRHLVSNPGGLDQGTFCAALQGTGCCALAAANAVSNMLGATCHPQVRALQSLFAACQPQLPPACSSYTPPAGLLEHPLAPSRDCQPVTLPLSGECRGVQKQACPATSCQLLCAIATLDPPPDAPGVTSRSTSQAQNAAARAAQQRLSGTAGAACDALSIAMAAALALAHFAYRRREPALSSARETPSAAVAAGVAAARGVAAAAAVAGVAATACVLPGWGLCSSVGTLPLPLPLRAAGVALGYVSLACYVSAAAAVAAAQPATLLRDGFYDRCRHPQLVAALGVGAGVVLATRSGLAVPGIAALWLMAAASALGEEERELQATFGSKWEAWKATTPALLPRLRGQRPCPTSPLMVPSQPSFRTAVALQAERAPLLL